MDPSLQATANALAQARAGAEPAVLADALLRHANALAASGRLADASGALDEALALQRLHAPREDVRRCLLLAAELLRLQGRHADAAGRAREALALAAGSTHEQAAAHAVLGEVALSEGDAAGAERAFDVALAATPGQPAWRRSRARARAAQGRYEAAAQDLEEASALCAARGDEASARRAAVEAATAWHQAGRRDRSSALVSTTFAQAQAAHDATALGALELLRATAALEHRDGPAAAAHARAARTHALAARAPDTYIGAAVTLSTLADHAGDDPGAYGPLATGWATLSDLLGPELARAAFEPPLRALHLKWGAERFEAARGAYEATRRQQRGIG